MKQGETNEDIGAGTRALNGIKSNSRLLEQTWDMEYHKVSISI